VLALGGASWKKTGSDGSWLGLFKKKNINTVPFQASNCGVNINWSPDFIKNHQGKPLKNIRLTINSTSIKGEALITSYGLEGNAIYPIVKEVRACFNKGVEAVIKIDFKPKNSIQDIQTKIKNTKPKQYIDNLNLNSVEMTLLKNHTTKEEYLDSELFSVKVKELPIQVVSLRSIDEAISTVGGVEVNNLNRDFSLKHQPNFYVIGEMVDWDAPTGGYLLQGCFSMGALVAQSINQKL
jgi:predicted Rossmann fold flavoprotein